MKNLFTFSILLAAFLLSTTLLSAQVKIDSTFSFQLDPNKKYSLYIPSSYNPATPQTVMLGLHPFNTNRWDAKSWRDTLTVFAETNNLLLVCPDGGADGKVDDPIDTAFTSALLDSVRAWYNVNDSRIFAMGFSWGSKTVYTYGLNHPGVFAGFMPVGAAISGTGDVNSVLNNAPGSPYYIIHGSLDSPNSRFFPIRDSLINRGACVETNLLTGVGHTIDFPNRNAILSTGWAWLDSVNCQGPVLGLPQNQNQDFWMLNPVPKGEKIRIKTENQEDIQIINLQGQTVRSGRSDSYGNYSTNTANLKPGIYFVQTGARQISPFKKLIIF